MKIYIYVKDGFIVVENNLQKKPVTLDDSPGVDLNNIVNRYVFLSDRTVEIVQNEKFVVMLPIIPED